jgi:undecaprenyl-diphosphatase
MYIFGAKYLFILSPILALIWFYKLPKEKRGETLIFTALALPTAFILAKIASHFYFNPRPFVTGGFAPLIPHAPDNGFPSDHALLVSAIASVVTFMDIRKSMWFWLIAIIVAISRVGVGVHNPLDVTASAIIAAVTAYVVHFVLKWYTNRNAKR